MEKEKNTESFLTIAALWHLCVAQWRWFVASVLFCLFIAVAYLISKPFLYTRKAVVMVREETLGKSTTEKNGDEFNDIGFVKQKSNVTNVIRHYKSLDVLMEVAHRLDSTLKDGYLIYKAEDIQSRLAIDNEDMQSTVLDITYRDYSTANAWWLSIRHNSSTRDLHYLNTISILSMTASRSIRVGLVLPIWNM